MSMTEQEIRADERVKVVSEVEAAAIFNGMGKGVCAALAKYLRTKTADGWCPWKGTEAPVQDRNLVVEIERRDGTRHTATVENHGIWWDQSRHDPRVIVRWRLPVAKPEPVSAPPPKPLHWPWTFSHTVKVPPPVPMPDTEYLRREFGKYHKSAMAFMAAVEAVAGAEAVLNEAARKGYP